MRTFWKKCSWLDKAALCCVAVSLLMVLVAQVNARIALVVVLNGVIFNGLLLPIRIFRARRERQRTDRTLFIRYLWECVDEGQAELSQLPPEVQEEMMMARAARRLSKDA